MGSAEQVTVRKIGTPQLLQSENLDAMYAHDTIMALEFAIPPQLAACWAAVEPKNLLGSS